MTNNQILKVADFMYSSNKSSDVPFRISLEFGMCGICLNRESFIKLLQFLNTTNCTKEEFLEFRNEVDDE